MADPPDLPVPRQPPDERSEAEDTRVLFGRDDEVERVARSVAPVLLVTGDSGVGKSDVLAAAQSVSELGPAPPPLTVGRPSGSLQHALMEALAQATATLVRERGLAAEVGQRLTDAAVAIARDRGERLAQVVGTELLNLVKGRLGEGVGDALGDYASELRAAGDEQLEARIRAQMDPTVAEIVLALAGEVVELAGEEAHVVLALDAVEELGDEDLRLLTDLVDALPARLHLRLGFATYSATHQDHVEDLLAASVGVVENPLGGISIDAVGDWLRAEGLEPGAAQAVHRVTDGYPLVIGDVVKHLQGGGDVDDAPRLEQFIRRTQQAWRELDPAAREAARSMVVLRDPLPEVALQELTGLDAAGWGDVVERLRRARILSTHVNGVPWFHEQRRQAILDVLRHDERQQLSAAAADATLAVSLQERAPRLTAEVAALVAEASPSLAARPHLQAAVALDANELALSAALFELFEPASMNPIDADDVLRHARAFFGGEDLVPALESLGERGLFEVAQSDARAVVVPAFDDLTAATVQGRALLELGRLPLPGLASSVFNAALQPRLMPFRHAIYGLGRGSLAHLAEMAKILGRVPPGTFLGRGDGNFLLVRAQFHGRPLAGTVHFESDSDRDAAQARLEGLAISVLGGQLEITDALAHPGTPLPANRLYNALKRLAVPMQETLDQLKRELTPPLGADEHADRKVQAVALVRELSGDVERLVYDLEDPMALHWHYDDDVLIEGEVYGVDEAAAVRHDDVPPFSDADPYLFFHYAEAFGVNEAQRLAHLRAHAGAPLANDPVVDMVGRIRARAVAWNVTQRRLPVPTAPDALAQMLLETRQRELRDALKFEAARCIDGTCSPTARALYVAIHHDPTPGGFLGVPALNAAYREMESQSGEEEVHVTAVPTRPPSVRLPDRTDDVFNEAFGVDFDAADRRGGGGVGSHVIAKLLGYRDDDIMLVRDDGTPADML